MEPESLTLSVKGAAKLLGMKRTAFFEFRKRVGLLPVTSSSESRPRYRRDDLVRLASANGVVIDMPSREAFVQGGQSMAAAVTLKFD